MTQTTRPPSMIGQMLLSFFGNSSGYIVAIITGIVVARELGPAGKGIASYAALVMALFTAFGDGIQASVMHECGRHGRPQILAYGGALRLLGLGMLPIAAALVAIGIVFPQHASLVYVACAVPFAVYIQIANSIFLLNNDVRATVISGTVPTFGVAALTIPALTVFHGGLTAVLAIWAAMFGASAIFAMIRLNRYLPVLTLESTWQTVREQAVFGVKSGFTTLAAFLNLRIDVFVVSAMLDARTLGIYTLAVATGELMWQVSRPVVWSTEGRVATAGHDRAIALTSALARNILAVEFVLGVLIFIFAPAAVRFVYGPAYAESGLVVRWLLPGLILYASQAPLQYYITVKAGKPGPMLAIQIASVIACAAITALTIRHLNIFGAAFATVFTYCCAALATCVLYARYTGASFGSFLFLQRDDVERGRRIAGRLVERLFPQQSRRADLGSEA